MIPRKNPSGMLISERIMRRWKLSSITSFKGNPEVVSDPISGKIEMKSTKTNEAAISIAIPLIELIIYSLKLFMIFLKFKVIKKIQRTDVSESKF
jgi:hypothetical protein